MYKMIKKPYESVDNDYDEKPPIKQEIQDINEKIKEAKKKFLETLENREKDKMWLYKKLKLGMQLEGNGQEPYCAEPSIPDISTPASVESNQLTVGNDKNNLRIPQDNGQVASKKPTTPNLLVKIENTALLRIHCSLCDIYCTEQYFYSKHIFQFPHSSMSILRTHYLPEIANSIYSVINAATEIFCNLCEVSMKDHSSVKSHENGPKHIKKFKHRFPKFVFKPFEKPKKKKKSQKIKLPSGTTQALVAYTECIPPKSSASLRIYCSDCDSYCTREYFYNHHIFKFPHSSMETLKACYSPEIFNSLYLARHGTEIYCIRCNVTMKSTNDVNMHTNGRKHSQNFKRIFPKFVG